MKREDVEFQSRDVICRAWLYRPESPVISPAPCVVMAHGLGGTRDAGLEPYAEKFAAAGYVVLLFDYRHFGASDGEPRQLLSIGRQLEDWAAAIHFARGLAGVDPAKIALWGSSFSGGHVLVAAARDGKVAAVSSQGPMMDGLAAALNVVSYAGIVMLLRLSTHAVLDQVRGLLGMPPAYIPLIAAPGQLAAMSSHDSLSGYSAIVPRHWRNEMAARLVLYLATYRPITYVKRLPCPILILACMKDTVAPVSAALATAKKAGNKAELKQYDIGHFDIYVGEGFARSSADQLAFFNRVLLSRS
jgi:pimeloyl-ACP methyl ester carboxylesterase